MRVLMLARGKLGAKSAQPSDLKSALEFGELARKSCLRVIPEGMLVPERAAARILERAAPIRGRNAHEQEPAGGEHAVCFVHHMHGIAELLKHVFSQDQTDAAVFERPGSIEIDAHGLAEGAAGAFEFAGLAELQLVQ